MKPLDLAHIVALSLLLSGGLTAEPDPFAELSQEMEKLDKEGTKEEMEEFQQWKETYLAEYQKFRKEHFNRLDDIRDQLINTWGEAEVSTPSKLVEYSEDDSIKSVFDFEANEVRISVLHSKDEAVELDKVQKALAELEQISLTELPEEEPGTEKIPQLLAQAEKKVKEVSISSEALLASQAKLIEEQSIAQKNQVERLSDLAHSDTAETELPQQEAKTEKQINAQLKQIDKEKTQRLHRLKQKVKAAESSPPRKQEVTTFTIPLAQRSEMTMARPYIDPVLKQSSRWQLEPSLTMAIIHTESHFNPKAQSHVPAFGLMQIVPLTAGHDVNRFLYQQNAPMKPMELLKPTKNIETGVAYMHLLNSRYLKGIEDPKSRRYCMIAAYNTGSGNVARSFNKDKSRNIKKAATVINSLGPEQVYNHLSRNLPYEETKKYLKKVTQRQGIYSQLDKI